MVMRYFGSKAGLLEAAVTVDLELPDLSSVPAGQVGHTLIRHFLTRWEQDDTLVILLRSSIGDSELDRKSTRLNSSHVAISYAVFCLKKKRIANVNRSLGAQ